MKIDMKGMRAGADEATALLRGLANQHRLLILCRLIYGESSVGALSDFLGIRDSTVSQHLGVLRRDRLVRTRRDGQTIWYAISSAPARAVIEALHRSYCGASDEHGSPPARKARRAGA